MPELMKGHKWRDHKHKMTYPAWAEIKTDEIRCHVIINPQTFEVTYLSFAGKPLHNMQKFDVLFAELAMASGIFEMDLGFEVNGNYNDSYRWVRSSSGIPEDLVNATCKFLLFDLPHLNESEYRDRYYLLHQLTVTALGVFDEPAVQFCMPWGQVVHDAAAVDALFLRVRAAGHEGLMVKTYSHLYQRGKRSYGWLKVKPEDDADGTITALHEAISDTDDPSKGLYVGKRLGRIGSVTIAVDDGSTATPHGIPHDLGVDMFQNPEKYVGQWAEFKYMERDRQGGYRHPVFHRLREAKA